MEWAHRNRCVCTKKWQTKNQSITCQPQSGKLGAPPGTCSNVHQTLPAFTSTLTHTVVRLQSMAHLHHSPHHSFTHSSPAWLSATEPDRSSYFIADLLKPGGWALVCVELCWGGGGTRTKTEMMASIVRGFFLWDPGTKSRANQRGRGAHTDNTAVTQLSLMLPMLAWRYGGNVNKRHRPLALLWFPLMYCLLYSMFFFRGQINNNLFQSKANR